MKVGFLAATLIVITSELPAQAQQNLWSTAGIQTNPTTNQILADTGALDSGAHRFRVVCASSAQAVLIIEWRNAANAANKSVGGWERTQAFVVAAFGTEFIDSMISFGDFEQGERIRVRLNAGITGTAQCSIFLTSN